MKLYLVVDEKTEAPAGYTKLPLQSLQSIENGTCEIIHVNSCMGTIRNLSLFLKDAYSKLHYGGKIVIDASPDLYSICMGVGDGLLAIQNAQMLLYKDNKMAHALNIILMELRGLGARIINYDIIDYQYHLEAERPKI